MGSIFKTGSGDVDMLMPQNSIMGRNILDPAKGSATYNQFAAAIQKYAPNELEAFNNGVKANILAPSHTANRFGLALQPKQMSGVLNGVGAKVMTPQEIQELKLSLTAQGILDQRLVSKVSGETLASAMTSGFGNLTGRAGTAGLGYYFGEIPGAIAAEIAARSVSAVGKKISHSYEKSKAFSGAPTKGYSGVASQYLQRAAPAVPAMSAPPLESDTEAPRRARGGKVGHQHLVDRLMRLAEQAKKASNASTEPLLNAPDEAVIKALDIAQRHI
jgi:hypothetical protein